MSEALAARVRDGEQAALARAITLIENREDGYRDLVAALHEGAGDARVLGITGSPGAGKSTLVDRLVATLRERGETVGVVAVDPSSPFSGGAVLGDRVRMAAARGDEGVFVRSMSARGAPGGLAAATADAVTALDAAGYDRVIVETVGAGQSEVEVVRTADTVAVLVPPGSGDDVQLLKAGILEIADVFVVNKADQSGADRTARELARMVERRDGDWRPPIVETVATEGAGVDEFLDAVDDHRAAMVAAGRAADRARARHAATIRAAVRAEVEALVERELARRGGAEAAAERVLDGEDAPYDVVEDLAAAVRPDPDEGRQP